MVAVPSPPTNRGPPSKPFLSLNSYYVLDLHFSCYRLPSNDNPQFSWPQASHQLNPASFQPLAAEIKYSKSDLP